MKEEDILKAIEVYKKINNYNIRQSSLKSFLSEDEKILIRYNKVYIAYYINPGKDNCCNCSLIFLHDEYNSIHCSLFHRKDRKNIHWIDIGNIFDIEELKRKFKNHYCNEIEENYKINKDPIKKVDEYEEDDNIIAIIALWFFILLTIIMLLK